MVKRTRIRQISKKKAARNREYTGIRAFVAERAGGLCEAQTSGVCTTYGQHAHHVLRRSQGGQDEPSNLLFVCAKCHMWIHDHPDRACALGLLMRPGVAS